MIERNWEWALNEKSCFCTMVTEVKKQSWFLKQNLITISFHALILMEIRRICITYNSIWNGAKIQNLAPPFMPTKGINTVRKQFITITFLLSVSFYYWEILSFFLLLLIVNFWFYETNLIDFTQNTYIYTYITMTSQWILQVFSQIQDFLKNLVLCSKISSLPLQQVYGYVLINVNEWSLLFSLLYNF